MLRIGKVETAQMKPGKENYSRKQPEKSIPKQVETVQGKFDQVLQAELQRMKENLVIT